MITLNMSESLPYQACGNEQSRSIAVEKYLLDWKIAN